MSTRTSKNIAKKKLSTLVHVLSQKYLQKHPDVLSWTFVQTQDDGLDVLLQKIKMNNKEEVVLRYEKWQESQRYWRRTENFSISIQKGTTQILVTVVENYLVVKNKELVLLGLC